MTSTDVKFFHSGVSHICGSLGIETVARRCLEFLKAYCPADSVAMYTYDRQVRAIRTVAVASDRESGPWSSSMPLPPDLQRAIEESGSERVEIVNDPAGSPLTRFVTRFQKTPDSSHMILYLGLEGERLGVVSVAAGGRSRYTSEHARLLGLLHDPFAIALSNALRHAEVLRLKELLADDNRYLSEQLHEISGVEAVGADFGLRDVMEMVRQVASLNSQILLLGETGVGKEVIANAIHFSSPRSQGPFIKVNCGAIPESLLDSELFGHEKGAFTGAVSRKRGRFERANGGTIFLDEIGEFPLQAQVRLLRVVQTREIERVGGGEPVAVDIRIIAATHRDLPDMVRSRTFREDLWFRLNVFPITVPPLRQRREDIPALVGHFIERKAKEMNLGYRPVPAPDALDTLRAYAWPGNVRELENVIERALIRHQARGPGMPLRFEELLSDVGVAQVARQAVEELPRPLDLDEVVRGHIRAVLERTGGRVQGDDGAAALLGVNPSTLRNRMRKLGIPYGRRARGSRRPTCSR